MQMHELFMDLFFSYTWAGHILRLIQRDRMKIFALNYNDNDDTLEKKENTFIC